MAWHRTSTGGPTPPADPDPASTATPHLPTGLRDDEVDDRVRRGLVNELPTGPSKTVSQIVRSNVFTRFNAILAALLVVVIIVGPPQDALFAGVLVSNTAIGIFQEVRAKMTLDRLALVTSPRVAVVRNGAIREVSVRAVVVDDLVLARPGDQIVADGNVVDVNGLEVDESLLTGESDPVVKERGDPVLSGSFVAAGSGYWKVTRVGQDSYAADLAGQARRFVLVRSELREGIDRILRIVQWLLGPTAVLLVTSQLVEHSSIPEALRSSVAGVSAMVPEGLVLLTSIAFAVGALRLSRLRVLVQELPALEGLARVDVVCIDKTGTLTSGQITLASVEPLDDRTPVDTVLASLAAADPNPNASLRALRDGLPEGTPWPADSTVAFSSARKWSAASFGRFGAWVLGAPEVMLAEHDGPGEAATLAGHVRARADLEASTGRRVLLLARAPAGLRGEVLPADIEPVALVALDERVRDDAAETLRYFASQGVAVKVISGDNPHTVGAVVGRLGLPGADAPVDARTLPTDRDGLADALDQATVFGRVTPQQKRAMVGALQSRGHVVAMTGDGVNDVLALKDADLGVAMGTGSAATRAVAQLVLLDDEFASLPAVVAEGRRVIANVERVANLFVTKTVYAMLLAIAVGVAQVPFPFLPRHLTIISTLTIGIPGFALALASNAPRARPGFVGRVLRFAVPTGLVAAAATFGAYALARHTPATDLGTSRTTATIVLFSVGLWILSILARPLTLFRRAVLAGSVVAFGTILFVGGLSTFFDLHRPPIELFLAAIGIIAIAGSALETGWALTTRLARWWTVRAAARD